MLSRVKMEIQTLTAKLGARLYSTHGVTVHRLPNKAVNK